MAALFPIFRFACVCVCEHIHSNGIGSTCTTSHIFFLATTTTNQTKMMKILQKKINCTKWIEQWGWILEKISVPTNGGKSIYNFVFLLLQNVIERVIMILLKINRMNCLRELRKVAHKQHCTECIFASCSNVQVNLSQFQWENNALSKINQM